MYKALSVRHKSVLNIFSSDIACLRIFDQSKTRDQYVNLFSLQGSRDQSLRHNNVDLP